MQSTTISIKALQKILSDAALAPSGHNTQPWIFKVEDNSIRILPNYIRQLSIVDPNHRELFVSLGCALENLALSAKVNGFHPNINILPKEERDECIRIHLEDNQSIQSVLHSAIKMRHTNRGAFTGASIPPEHLEVLRKEQKESGVRVKIITEANAIAQMIKRVQEANTIQLSNPAFKNELVSWIRFNKQETQKHQDGLSYKVMRFPAIPWRWLGKLIVNSRLKPAIHNRVVEQRMSEASALLLFSTEKNDKRSWIQLGRYFQRMMLTATYLGISHSHFNQLAEVAETNHRLKEYLKMDSFPALLIRLGYAEQEALASPRRDLDRMVV